MASLATIAAALVPDFAQQLQEQGISLPERQYFAPGQIVAMDGEQLVGWFVGVAQGGAGIQLPQSQHPAAVRFAAQFAIILLRQIPIVQAEPGPLEYAIPTANDINDAGLSFVADGEALLRACQAIHREYLITYPGMDFEVGPLQTVGPEGGLAGPKILLTVSIG